MLKQIQSGEVRLVDQEAVVRVVKVRNGNPPLVRVELSSSRRLDASHVDELKRLLVEQVGRPVILEAQMNLRR